MLKALSPAAPADGEPIRFADGTAGHADGANAGFLRDDALLVVVVVSDKTDCSVRDPAAFFAEPGNWGVLCATETDAHWPVERYVDGLRRVRDARRLLVVAIAGVPADLLDERDPGAFDADALLADRRMQITIDASAGGLRVTPSCDPVGPPTVWATPPRRLAALAGALGDAAMLVSLCRDFSGSVPAVATGIQQRLR